MPEDTGGAEAGSLRRKFAMFKSKSKASRPASEAGESPVDVDLETPGAVTPVAHPASVASSTPFQVDRRPSPLPT